MTIRLTKKDGAWWKNSTQEPIPTDPGTGGGTGTIAKPDATNTGHNPATITGTVAGMTITSPGYVLENKIVTGSITVKAANVVIRNCYVKGGATADTLVKAWDAACVNLTVEHCTLAPTVTGINSQGIHGKEYTARYNNVYNVVDGFGAFNTAGSTTGANVLIERNWVHDLTCLLDPARSDGITHNDCVQIHGSGGVHILYNSLEANHGVNSDAGVGGMSCVMMAPSTTYGPDCPDVRIENNWLNYGSACLNLGRGDTASTSQAIVRGNRFGRKGTRSLGASIDTMTFRILAQSALDCPGLPTITGTDISNGNVFDDTGLPVTVNRG